MNRRKSWLHVTVVLLAAILIICPAAALAQQVPETKKGIYEVEIEWKISKRAKRVKIVNVTETDLGEVPIFRDQAEPLSIKAKVHPLSPDTVEFRIMRFPLMVKDPHPPFSIVAVGMDGVGGGFDKAGNITGSIIQVSQVKTQVQPLAEDLQLIYYDTVLSQSLLNPVTSGILKVTYTCETCPSNPCVIGLD